MRLSSPLSPAGARALKPERLEFERVEEKPLAEAQMADAGVLEEVDGEDPLPAREQKGGGTPGGSKLENLGPLEIEKQAERRVSGLGLRVSSGVFQKVGSSAAENSSKYVIRVDAGPCPLLHAAPPVQALDPKAQQQGPAEGEEQLIPASRVKQPTTCSATDDSGPRQITQVETPHSLARIQDNGSQH